MDHTDKSDLVAQVKQLVAENINLGIKLNEHEFTAAFKEREMLEMKQQIVTGNELISKLDTQVIELELLQNYMDDLSNEKEGGINREMNFQQHPYHVTDFKYQLDDLKQQNNYLQIQVADLQAQMQELSNRNLLLQQQVSRVAELESHLVDEEQQSNKWKALAALKK